MIEVVFFNLYCRKFVLPYILLQVYVIKRFILVSQTVKRTN